MLDSESISEENRFVVDAKGMTELLQWPEEIFENRECVWGLKIVGGKHLSGLPDFNALTSLQSLNLSGCKSLQAIPDVSGLTNLQSLDLGWCESLQSVLGLRALKNLKSLNMGVCTSLQTIAALNSLTGLESLKLSGCDSLQSIPDLNGLTNLRTLIMRSTPLINNKRSLADTSLERYEDDDPEFVAWILAQTRPRVSSVCYFKDFADWCKLIPRANDPCELLRVVTEGLCKCRGSDEPDNAIELLIHAALTIVEGRPTPFAWNALTSCFDLTDSKERALYEEVLALRGTVDVHT